MYHVGRPGEDGYANRVLQAWGLDGHNSHTNVCSSSARLGHFLWCGNDRPSPDYANAQTILLLSSHLETGHYFNPHAQRIIEGQSQRRDADRHRSAAVEHVGEGERVAARLFGHRGRAAAGDGAACCSTRSSTTASSCAPGSTGAATCAPTRPDLPVTFDNFIVALKELYAQFTPEFAADETGVAAAQIVEAARAIGRARGTLQHAQLARPPPPATSGAGRSRAASICWSCSPASVGTEGGVGPARHRTSSSRSIRTRRRRPTTGTSCCSRASTRSRSSR